MTQENFVPDVVNAPQGVMEEIVSDTPSYTIVKLPNGKYSKIMKYAEFSTIVPETEEEKKELFSVMNDSDNNDKVVPMKDAVGLELEIVDFFTRPYEKFDEDTGENLRGVVTTIKSTDGLYYVTSSKSVYYSLQNIVATFGLPGSADYKPTPFTIVAIKEKKGQRIDIKIR